MPRSGSGKVTVKDMLVGEVAKTDFVVGGAAAVVIVAEGVMVACKDVVCV